MLLKNILYSEIDLYVKKINQYLSDSYIINADFKTYDKSQNDVVIFKCFDINSQVKTNCGVMISERKYFGYLEFTYSKITNEVYVSKLPYVMSGKVEMPIFTSDIAQIIVDKVKGYIPKEEIKLNFSNPVSVFAIDNKVKETIPSFSETKNYNIINYIIDEIALEEKRIRQHILNLKAQKDREDKAIERAISKKRKIYGIDSKDYENQQEFYNVVNNKICEVYTKKAEKIKRHLKLNICKYKQLIKNGIKSMYSNDMDFICNNSDFCNWCEHNGISISKFKGVQTQNNFWGSTYFYDKDVDDEQVKKEVQQIIDKYIEDRFYHDLGAPRGILALVDFVKKEIMTLPELREEGRINNNTLYTYVVTQLASMTGNGDRNGWANGKYDYIEDHPIFGKHNYSYIRQRSYQWWMYTYRFSRDIGLAIELLLQIRTLTKQLQYCNLILNNPSSAILSFKKDNDSWNSIMQYPYFVRMGRDSYKSNSHETFNLFMIKPGTITFDDKNIRYFIQKDDKKKNVSSRCDRMVVAIPDSLQYHSLLKVIQYAHNYGKKLNIICQSPDLASRVKTILVTNELNARGNNGRYIEGDYFINVDPNYYDSFFVDTPDNKEFWHRYDYSSDYKYRRKIIYDLKTIIDMVTKEYGEKIDANKKNNNILLEMILGGYSCDEDYFNLEKFLLDKQGVDGRTLSDDCDRVLAFMQLYPKIWKRELPLIDNSKGSIDIYLENSYEEFLTKKEKMLMFRELFSSDWQEMWSKMYLSSSGNSLYIHDIKDLQAQLLIFKDLFSDDWKNMWFDIFEDKVLYDALVETYKDNPEETKRKVLIRKSKDWKNNIKFWLLGTFDGDDEWRPF